jgi:hypothetical protein
MDTNTRESISKEKKSQMTGLAAKERKSKKRHKKSESRPESYPTRNRTKEPQNPKSDAGEHQHYGWVGFKGLLEIQ